MAAADDTRPDADESTGRLGRSAGTFAADRDLPRQGSDDRGMGGVKQNVERVADKVKGLLRSHD